MKPVGTNGDEWSMRFYMRNCKRSNKHADDELCFCPPDGRIRAVLRKKFINGWIPEALIVQANKIADDESAQEKDLWALLFKIEDEANHCYGMWRNTL